MLGLHAVRGGVWLAPSPACGGEAVEDILLCNLDVQQLPFDCLFWLEPDVIVGGGVRGPSHWHEVSDEGRDELTVLSDGEASGPMPSGGVPLPSLLGGTRKDEDLGGGARGIARHVSVAEGLPPQPFTIRGHQGVADARGLVLLNKRGAAEHRLARELSREGGGGHL